jgi:hypothetical protein
MGARLVQYRSIYHAASPLKAAERCMNAPCVAKADIPSVSAQRRNPVSIAHTEDSARPVYSMGAPAAARSEMLPASTMSVKPASTIASAAIALRRPDLQ